MLVGNRLQNHQFFMCALELASENSNWACLCRLAQNERLVASVSAVHSHTLLGADKLAGLFHVATASQHGYSLGLWAIASPTDDVSTDLEEIQVDASPSMRPFFKVIMWSLLGLMLH
jgi:hypothetical protein